MIDLILKGIQSEAARYSVDVEALNMNVPAALQEWRERLPFRFESSSHRVGPQMIFDKGKVPPNTHLDLSLHKDGMFICDSSRRDPQHPDAIQQLCRLSLDRFGKVTSVQIDVDKSEFAAMILSLGPGSSLLERLAGIAFPGNFPAGRPDFAYFAAHAKVLSDDAERLSPLSSTFKGWKIG